MYKNIMLKISGESLAGDNEQGFDFDVLNDLSQNIKSLAMSTIKYYSALICFSKTKNRSCPSPKRH